MRGGGDEGQATVELALILPLLVMLLLGIVQVGLVARDAVAVTHAARVAARAAIVDPTHDAVQSAAADAVSLDADRMDVSVTGSSGKGSRVVVAVSYRSPTDIPMIGRLLDDVVVSDQLVVMTE